VRNTLLAAFSLISVQEAAIVEKRACMAALIDFSSAYDTVHLPILESKLVALGFDQHSVAIVQTLTHGVSPRVKCLNQQGEPWQMMCGLRQGCPLSPLLFTLYVCDLHSTLMASCPPAGVTLFQSHFLDVMYADDLMLLAEGQAGMKLLIMEALIMYADANNLTINFRKSELIPLVGDAQPIHTSRGVLQVVYNAKYLGVPIFTHGHDPPLAARRKVAVNRARGAASHLFQSLSQSHMLYDSHIARLVIHGIIMPKTSYGACLWDASKHLLTSMWHAEYNTVPRWLYRRVMSLPPSSSVWLPNINAHILPCNYFILQDAINLWNAVIQLKDTSPLICSVWSVQRHLASLHKQCWLSRLDGVCNELNMPFDHTDALQLPCFRTKYFALMQAHMQFAMSPKPGHRSFLQLHAEQFMSPDNVPLLEPFHFDHVVCRFMHSMWPLAVHTHPSVESPLCCMCGLHDETEEHVLMHCPYLDLMQPEDLDFGTSLSDFLRQDSELVASWIHQCWSYLSDAKRSQTP